MKEVLGKGVNTFRLLLVKHYIFGFLSLSSALLNF